MPSKSRKRHPVSHSFASYPTLKRPTIKRQGFYVVSHKTGSMLKDVSMKNIHRSILNIIPKAVNKMNATTTRKMRESLRRVAKDTQKLARIEEQLRRDREKAEKEEKKNEKQARSSAKAATAASFSEMNNMFSKFHI